MKAKAWRLYGAADARLEDIELEGAGDEGVVVELVTNTICLSDYKAVSLGTGHKRVPRDIATRPTMFGHEISGIVREVGTKWKDQFHVGQHVGIQPAFNIPGHELETMGYAWHTIGGDTTARTTCVCFPTSRLRSCARMGDVQSRSMRACRGRVPTRSPTTNFSPRSRAGRRSAATSPTPAP